MLDAKADKQSGERGAILVLGIMLGAFLVGALFYVVGVGHAVVWRESVQAAADATAYEATAWNARGMNVVVAINIFMAIIMGILIAWRLALMFIGIVTALAGIACVVSVFVPVLAPACTAAGWAGRVFGRMMSRDTQVQQRIYRIIGVLGKGQAVVASAGPILSVARSAIANSQRPNVKMAVPLSTQMFPAGLLTILAQAPTEPITPLGVSNQALTADSNFRKGGRSNGGGNNSKGNTNNNNGNNGNGKGGKQPQCKNNNRGNQGGKGNNRTYTQRKGKPLLGKPYSLNAQESDDLDTFCGKAGEKMADPFKILAFEAIGLDGASDAGNGNFWGGLFKHLTKGMSGMFCGAFGAGGAADIIKDQISSTCKEKGAQDQYKDKKKKNESAQEACERILTEQQQDADETGFGSGKTRSGYRAGATNDIAWADVFGPFANGNMFGQTWAIVRAEKDSGRIDDLINVAASFGGGTSTIDNSDATVFAQAEMFFDCDEDWDACYENASWTMNWRARLRRVRGPLELASTGLEHKLSAQFTDILNAPPVQKVINGTPLAEFFSTASGSLLPASLKDPLEEMRDEVAAQGGEAAQWVVEQGPDRATIIH